MRKYILSIILIICGLTILIVNYSKQNSNTYSEATFAAQSEEFDLLFEQFTTQIKDHIFAVKNKYPDTFKLKDTIQYRDYFLDMLGKSKSLNSVGFFQGDHKLIIRRENSSYVIALDSTVDSEVVK